MPTAAPTPRPTTASAASPTTATASLGPEGVAWLRDQAIPFATTQPGHDFADLLPLKRLVGEARLVALGEATHGTHEFFTMKHRLLAFLVQELGFTDFALEAPWAEAERLNDWVRTGQGDPVTLLADLKFWALNTQEMLDLLRWLRAYNARPQVPRPVSFRGFDMQHPALPLENVLAYVRRVDPAALARFGAWYAPFSPYARRNAPGEYRHAAPSVKEQGREGVRRAHEALRDRRAEYEAASSPSAFAHALMSARIIAQAEEKWSAATDLEGARARDRFMAENAAWLLEQAGPGAKMVLWAHNGHIGGAPWGWPPVVVPRMGTHLKERYGEALILCGFAFYAGGCVAYAPGGVALQVHQVPPPPADSYEAAFRQAGLPHLFLDLRGLQFEAPATAWLAGPRGLRYIGAGYDATRPDAYVLPVGLPRQFDLVLYVEDTTPSHPLFPFGPPADTATVAASSAVATGLAG